MKLFHKFMKHMFDSFLSSKFLGKIIIIIKKTYFSVSY